MKKNTICFVIAAMMGIALTGCSEPEFKVDMSSEEAFAETFERLEKVSISDDKAVAFITGQQYLINKYRADYTSLVGRSDYQGWPRMQENLHGKTIDEIIVMAEDAKNNPTIHGHFSRYLEGYTNMVRQPLGMYELASFNDALDTITTVITAELKAQGRDERGIREQIAYFLHGRTADEIRRISPTYYHKRSQLNE